MLEMAASALPDADGSVASAAVKANGHAPRQQTPHPAHFFLGTFNLVQNAAPMRQQQLARFRGHGAATVACQQALMQLHLQQPHLTAQRGLRDVQGNGGAGKTTQFGDTHKVFQLFEVHFLPQVNI